jgi:hypothetical protein
MRRYIPKREVVAHDADPIDGSAEFRAADPPCEDLSVRQHDPGNLVAGEPAAYRLEKLHVSAIVAFRERREAARV